jgi:Tol biopolymer transport system component
MRFVPFTSHPGHQGHARFSPDGHWILYAQTDQVTSKIMPAENFRW